MGRGEVEGPWFRTRSSLNCWIHSAAVWFVIVNSSFHSLSLLLPFYFLRLDYVIFKPLIKGVKCEN